ncbi:MAG: urease accessory protein UreE [Porticoccaceae bacterium]|nr:urease accessory protein UreE [Porticoccaceae bacterium]
MLEIYQRLPANSVDTIDGELMLDHLQREKGRFKAVSSSDEEVRVFLERGHTLVIGEILRSNCGQHLLVTGAAEPVATATTDNWVQFSQACYHLGNRHVKMQIGDCWLRITPDHVLEDMLQQLGMQLRYEQAQFVPEPGAYFSRGKQGGHGHHH